MKNLTILFFALLANYATAQSWQWQNPLPQGHILEDVQMVDATTGYVAGRGGAILKTSDGGTTWSILTSGTLKDLYSLCFTDVNTGYVVGDSGLILKTINGGADWNPESSGTFHRLHDLFFTNPNTGYICGESGLILKTINGGNTWTSQVTGFGY
jgi:photosystem II stability/assembly factor-like uncharacterized protein